MFDVEINKINQYLKEQLWMDFEMCCMDRAKLVLYGFLDESGKEKIRIVFEEPYMVSSNFFFTYEGKYDFITIIKGEEAVRINKKYGVTIGNIIFKLSNINTEMYMIVIAKGINVKILEST